MFNSSLLPTFMKLIHGGFSMARVALLLAFLLKTGYCELTITQPRIHSYQDSMLSQAVKDFMLALPTSQVVLVVDYTVDDDLLTLMSRTLQNETIMVVIYYLRHSTVSPQMCPSCSCCTLLYEDIQSHILSYTSASYFFMTNPVLSEEILEMIRWEDLIRRNLLYMFYWKEGTPSRMFHRFLIEALRVCVIVSRRLGTFQVLYSQAEPSGRSRLQIVNWWSTRDGGLYRHPLLPPADTVYKDFKGRLFLIPVLHKPPWHFVSYYNDSIDVEGGRDDKLLQLLAVKLNFKIEYFEPSEKNQGSGIINGTMNGVLGQIWRRDAEMFMGDLTVTYNRSQAVDFTFLTLADNEAFLTHSPGHLSEALALVHSFHWNVWPLVMITILVTGPLLFLILYIPQLWNPNEIITSSPKKLFYDCNWFIYAIFMKQGVTMPTKKHKVRFVLILLSLAATYVIGDMYSANLTSMLAKPAREKPITNLEQLADAMENQGYQLLVEKLSPSHGNVENGTGLYKKIWERMGKQTIYPLIESTEKGVKLVRDKRNIALIGGRETFFFDTRRFGAHNFHLSEKLYTRYSAIAVQLGCPFINQFNLILMRLFEAGILTKITEEEYEKLGENKRKEARKSQKENQEMSTSVAEGNEKIEEDDKLRPMSIKALQGGFFILIVGHCISGFLLLAEVIVARNYNCLEEKAKN